jgi:hypothetical protein
MLRVVPCLVISTEAFLLILSVLAPSSAWSGRNKWPTSICKLGKLSRHDLRRPIEIKGVFVSDRRERSFIQDKSCPNIIVTPFDSENIEKNAEYGELDRVLDEDAFKLGLTRVDVRVFGKLSRAGIGEYRIDVYRYVAVSRNTRKSQS